MPHAFVPSRDLVRARRLRRDQTEVERKLWLALRGGRFERLHFKRQAPMGPYVVDFVSHQAKLIVELDGGQHALPAESAKDGRRDAWFKSEGYTVLRFWNGEVNAHLDGVLGRIGEAARVYKAITAGADPSPHPSPTRGEGDALRIDPSITTRPDR